MTQEEFAKKRWQHSEKMLYVRPGCNPIECMLLGVDFENDLMRLVPFDTERYEEAPFWTRVEYCRRPLHVVNK